jgi:hexosaminidase
MTVPRITLLFALPALSAAATVSPLGARGYAVLPEPQQVTLGSADFRFGSGWGVQRRGVSGDDIAVTSLLEGLRSRFHVTLPHAAPAGGAVTLALAPGSVPIGDALDSDKQAISAQAYKIDLSPAAITITANAPAGLFYGAQTLLQLIKPRGGSLWLPEGRIVDWPDLRLRQIYWDDAHHLERPEALRHAIRQAAFYKINGFVIKLEGHFQYKSAPAIVEPWALSPAELQSLTDYALKRHVQLIPYLDGPAHIAFILKHPEYAKLREFPDSNYEACVVNPDTYKMYEGMFQDLLDANRGVKYFYLSTDEPYYVGLADNPPCNEAARAKELGSVGKLLAEFVAKTAGWLHDHGREVIFWGEYPLKPGDIDSLPPYMINGEVYGPEFDPVFKRHGIRQMIYVSTQGEERHFPEYFPMASSRRLHGAERRRATPKVEEIIRNISTNPARKNAELMGVVNAGWADAGLHPETFWLGYAAGTAAGWHAGSPEPEESMSRFYRLFYGWHAGDMDRVYRLLSWQAQFWTDSWETGPSQSRKPIWGNSDRIYQPKQPARDQFLPLPPAPAADLKYDSAWSRDNARRLELAESFLAESDELLSLLHRNLQQADFNLYNLEVLLSVARVLRQNLTMLTALGRMDALLAAARDAAAKNQARQALAAVDQALNLAREIRRERNAVLRDATATWYKSWRPRVPEANGRKFLHELDDVKDHAGDRTVDLSYMIQRELLLPFGDWVNQVRAARNEYAKAHHAPLDNQAFDWKDYQDAQ